MQGLIQRSWSHDPRARPSFGAIFREFQVCGFPILPEVDADKIREAVDEILA
jgi:hypothetical protein